MQIKLISMEKVILIFIGLLKKKRGAIKAFNALFVCNRYICKTVIDVTMEKERKDSETGESW